MMTKNNGSVTKQKAYHPSVQTSPGLPFTGDELRKRLRLYDRQPFIELLAAWLECAPTMEAVHAFAVRSPDKYATAITQIARVAGYTEKTESTHNINVNVGQMSDSQIEDQLRQMQRKLGLTDDREVIDDHDVIDDCEVIDIDADDVM